MKKFRYVDSSCQIRMFDSVHALIAILPLLRLNSPRALELSVIIANKNSVIIVGRNGIQMRLVIMDYSPNFCLIVHFLMHHFQPMRK